MLALIDLSEPSLAQETYQTVVAKLLACARATAIYHL
jgi:hypothetical protein